MSKKVKVLVAIAIPVLLLCLLLIQPTPKKRVTRYVEAHQTELQTAVDRYFDHDQLLSYDSDIPAVNVWPGPHPMVEYLLFTGSGYCGFYYSPDDVPLSFQNGVLPLAETDGGWEWHGEGDNRGFTSRLSPRWYFFEAHF